MLCALTRPAAQHILGYRPCCRACTAALLAHSLPAIGVLLLAIAVVCCSTSPLWHSMQSRMQKVYSTSWI